MRKPGVDPEIDIPLKDGRTYVRTTDFLREVAIRFPSQGFSVRFLRPMGGRCILTEKRPDRPTAAIILRGRRYFVSDIHSDVAPQTANSPPNPGNFNFRIGTTYFFIFRTSRPFLDNLEACFDITHPRLAHKLGVRFTECCADIGENCRFVWFTLHGLKGDDQCRANFRTLFGTRCKVRFFQRNV